MQSRLAKSAGLIALAWAGSLGAHHSESMFEPLPHWVSGRIIEFERINPHSIITLEETTADGQTRRVAVESPDPARLDRRGIGPDFLKPGDEVSFCAFPIKAEFVSRHAESPPFVHGKVVLMPDGKMEIWGSYGVLTNCVRPNDPIRPWVDFVDSNDLAWTAWCRRFSSIPTREDSKALVEKISSMMANPCN